MSKRIELTVPIVIKEDGTEKTISHISFERPKLKHLRLLPDRVFSQSKKKKGEMDLSIKELIPILAALSGMPEDYVEEIDLSDLQNIAEEFGNLFDGSL